MAQVKGKSTGFNYERYESVVQHLKDAGKFNEDMFWFNVVSPYLMSLGYNLYDLEGADFDSDNKVIYFDVYEKSGNDKVVISCGLFDLNVDDIGDEGTLTNLVVNEHQGVHYLYFNMEDLSITLYLILNGNIYQLTKSEPGEARAKDKFRTIMQRVARPVIQKGFTDNGKSFFTTMVLIGLLAQKSYVKNSFIEDTLLEMFKDPSEELIRLLSTRLREKYINKETNEEVVYEKLAPIKDSFFEVVKSTLDRDDFNNMEYSVGSSVTSGTSSEDYNDIELEAVSGTRQGKEVKEVEEASIPEPVIKSEPRTQTQTQTQTQEKEEVSYEDINFGDDYGFDNSNEDDMAYGVFSGGNLNNLLGEEDGEDDSNDLPKDTRDLGSILGG